MSYKDFARQAMEALSEVFKERSVFPLDVEAEEAWDMFTELLTQKPSLPFVFWYQTYGATFQEQFADYWHGIQYLVAESLGYV